MKRGPAPSGTSLHRDEIIAMYRSGLTLQGIGDRFGVTRERIRQLLRRWEIDGQTGGIAMRAAMKRVRCIERREANSMRRFGCSWAEYKAMPRAARNAYNAQKTSAGHRGIGFELRLAEWWQIWSASGKWHLRGRHKGQYVMSRLNDRGSYALGNVYITTTSVNCAEGGGKAPRQDKAMHGIYLVYPGMKKPWVAKHNRRYLGAYASPDEARAARQNFLAQRAANG